MPTCSLQLDENANTPVRIRRNQQKLARLLNRGLIAGRGLAAGENCKLEVSLVSPLQFGTADVVEINIGNGLENDGGALAVDLATDPGLQFTGGDLDLLLKADGGLATDASGAFIDMAGLTSDDAPDVDNDLLAFEDVSDADNDKRKITFAELAALFVPPSKVWPFRSRTSGAGTSYIGGFYVFAPLPKTFSPIVASFGTANNSYAAHFWIVTSGGGFGNTTIKVTGTSITDAGVRTTADTENLTIVSGEASGTYHETAKKWLGLVTISKVSGPSVNCNFGYAKYWDANDRDFRILGLEALWLGGGNDAGPDIRLRHHKSTGWAYNGGSPATPPTPLAAMATDHVTEDEVNTDEPGAWKRDNLNTLVAGSAGEGVIVEIKTAAANTFNIGTFELVLSPLSQ